MHFTANALSYDSTVWNNMRISFTGLVWVASHLIPYGMKSYILHHRFRTTPEEHRPSIVEAAASIDEKSLYNIVRMAVQEIEEIVEVPWDILDSLILIESINLNPQTIMDSKNIDFHQK